MVIDKLIKIADRLDKLQEDGMAKVVDEFIKNYIKEEKEEEEKFNDRKKN